VAEACRSLVIPSVPSARTSRARPAYRPPSALSDLHILDVLELSESQGRAAAALQVSQSTVSRSLQLMRREYRLTPGERQQVIRHGHNPCVHYLRLAYREHRLMEGLLRIGSDGLHQPLLQDMAGVQLAPPRFRSAEHWVELLRHGLLDGAIVSSFALAKPLPAGEELTWEGIAVLPLASVGLLLVSEVAHTRRVLLPGQEAMPLLHQLIQSQGFGVEPQRLDCEEPAAWLKLACDRQLAIPVVRELVGRQWLRSNQLEPLVDQPVLEERLWLLLPEGTGDTTAAQGCWQGLRGRVARAMAK
jgi:DNA-binding transcriptional LysR family regulator